MVSNLDLGSNTTMMNNASTVEIEQSIQKIPKPSGLEEKSTFYKECQEMVCQRISMPDPQDYQDNVASQDEAYR